MALENFNNKITWNDFKKMGSIPNGFTENAHIEINWNTNTMPRREGKAIVLDMNKTKTILKVDKESSWVLVENAEGPDADRLLNHEQGHYDFAALAAREYHTRLEKLIGSSQQDLQSKMKELRIEVDEKTGRVDKKYDLETNNGTALDEQKKWDSKIKRAKDSPQGSLNDLS